jgi:hypothetical protein
MTNSSKQWEVGGDFATMPWPTGLRISWPPSARWYALGRHCVSSLISGSKTTVWLPSYFCHEVTDRWQQDARISFYYDHPLLPSPDWSTLKPKRDDLVVAVNFFGVRGQASWRGWNNQTRALLIEDHSHDPASPWARKSSADYAFSSLRKTLPTADGAILWAPSGKQLANPPVGEAEGIAARRRAMLLKREYLQGLGTAGTKREYRALLRASEQAMSRSEPVSISSESHHLMADGIPASWRKRRAYNARQLLRDTRDLQFAKALFRKWPRDAAPLGLVLLFETRAMRDRCRSWLENYGVYCPIHWKQPRNASATMKEIGARILTIPVDQRYSAGDIKQIVAVLQAFPWTKTTFSQLGEMQR